MVGGFDVVGCLGWLIWWAGVGIDGLGLIKDDMFNFAVD